MKAISWHNFVVPCLSNIQKDTGKPSGCRGIFFLNPNAIYRYQPDGALITLAQIAHGAIYVDYDLSTMLKKHEIDVSNISLATYNLLTSKGLLLDRPPDESSYVENYFETINLPYYATLEVTHRCNCRCLTCYHYEDMDDYHPPLADLLIRINKLKSLGIMNLEISGGEPLLRDDLLDIINLINHIKMNYILITNGEYLKDIKPGLIKALKSATAVVISLDGVGIRHDIARNRYGLFDKLVQGAHCLFNSGINLGFIFTVTDDNVVDLPEALKLARLMHAKISIRPAKIVGSAKLNQVSSTSYKKVAQYVNDPAIINGFAGNQKISFEAKYYGCAIAVKIAVDARGIVHSCIMDRGRTIGNIEQYSTKTLVSDLIEETNFNLANQWCRDCIINQNGLVCAGICRFARKFNS